MDQVARKASGRARPIRLRLAGADEEALEHGEVGEVKAGRVGVEVGGLAGISGRLIGGAHGIGEVGEVEQVGIAVAMMVTGICLRRRKP